MRNVAIRTLTLPAAIGGSGTTTYSLSPALPDGLSFDAAARIISGTSTAVAASADYSYTATDGADTAMLRFAIQVLDTQEQARAMDLLSVPNISDQTWTGGVAVSFQLPSVSLATTYSLGLLPDGLSFNNNNRTISGTPTKVETKSVTYFASNQYGDSGSRSFTITIANPISFSTTTVADVTQEWGKAVSVSLPSASGRSNIAYTLSGDMPSGVSFSATNLTVSGTPTAQKARTQYTYTATSGGFSNSITFHMEITNPALSFGSATISNVATHEHVEQDIQLPAVTNTNTGLSVTYSLSPSLPSGLSFNASTRKITGKNTSGYPSSTYTYTASASNATSASLTFTLKVDSNSAPTLQAFTNNPTTTDYTTSHLCIGKGYLSALMMPQVGGTTNRGFFNDADQDDWTVAVSGVSANPDLVGWLGVTTVQMDGNDVPAIGVEMYHPSNDFTAVTVTGTDDKGATVSFTWNVRMTSCTHTVNARDESTGGHQVEAKVGSWRTTGVGSPFSIASGDVADAFSVDSSTGELTVKSGVTLNHATKSSYTGVLNYAVGSATAQPTYTINVQQVTVPPKMSSPTVRAHSTDPWTKVNVSWSKPSGYVDGYEVRYKKAADSSWSTLLQFASNLGTTMSGLERGVAYQFAVRAYNNKGTGPSSDTVNFTTAGNRAPAFSATGTTTVYHVENTAVGGAIGSPFGATDADGDTLYYSMAGAAASKVDVDGATGQIKVKSGHTLDYEAVGAGSITGTMRVSDRKNPFGNADTVIDDTVAVVITWQDANEPPTAPRNLAATNNTSNYRFSLKLAWDAPSPTDMADKPPVTGYDVRYKKSASSTWSVRTHAGTSTSTTLAGLDAGTQYSIRVRAKNDEGDGAWTTITASTLADQPPPKPAAPTLAQNAATPKVKLDISWTAPSTTGLPPVTDYDVRYRKKSTSTTAWTSIPHTGTGRSASVGGLENGTTYQAQVRASNEAGTGAWSDAGEGTTETTNTNPFFYGTTTLRIVENSSAGAWVGRAYANDKEADTLEYSLSGPDAAYFDLSTSTAAVTVKAGTKLDYETKNLYRITVSVTDWRNLDGDADTVSVDATNAYYVRVTDWGVPAGQGVGPGDNAQQVRQVRQPNPELGRAQRREHLVRDDAGPGLLQRSAVPHRLHADTPDRLALVRV